MAGHSKWNNIKRRKGAVDAARAKIFTKIGREIQVAVKAGGPDPESNGKLKEIIAKAKSQNMPSDNIQRSIKKAAGNDTNENYEEIIYEGYGPSGVAVLVYTLTDNRNRTAGDVRHFFDKSGGNMGLSGSVSFQFEQKGCLVLDRETYPDEDELMLQAIEAGAADVIVEEDVYVVYCEPADYQALKENLETAGFEFLDSKLGPVPNTWIQLDDEKQRLQMEKLIDNLEDLDDVQEVYHNWES